jgi:hypothetical protein
LKYKRIRKDFDFLNPKIKPRKQLGERVKVWGVHFDVRMAVQNPPSTSAALSVSINHNIVLVFAQNPHQSRQ